MVSKSKRKREAAQKRAAQAAAAPPAKTQPAKKAAKRKNKRKAANAGGGQAMSKNTSSGVDLFGAFVVNNTLAPGSLLFDRPLVPAGLDDTRVKLESSIWSRWRPKSIQIDLTGSAPTTAGGSLIVAWIADPSYVLRSGMKLINFALASERSHTFSLSGKASLKLPVDPKWLKTDGHPSEAGYGSVICVLISPPVGIQGNVSFMVNLRWTIEWSGKEIIERIYSPDVLVPDAGYLDLFTTSDGSFDAGYLTFKMHSGGSMVPFSNARPGVVYTVDKSTTVYYNAADGSEKQCKFFSRVIGYATPGLLLHESEDLARSYQTTGDRTKAIAYHSASKVATPSTLRFVEVAVEAVSCVRQVDEVAALREEVSMLKGFFVKLFKKTEPQSVESVSQTVSQARSAKGGESDMDLAEMTRRFAGFVTAGPSSSESAVEEDLTQFFQERA